MVFTRVISVKKFTCAAESTNFYGQNDDPGQDVPYVKINALAKFHKK